MNNWEFKEGLGFTRKKSAKYQLNIALFWFECIIHSSEDFAKLEWPSVEKQFNRGFPTGNNSIEV